jgi:hypothetical protein
MAPDQPRRLAQDQVLLRMEGSMQSVLQWAMMPFAQDLHTPCSPP